MTPAPAFAPTRWSLVLAARGDAPAARAALGELCAAYWPAVFRFLRREGRDEDAARELAQEFFARVLAGAGFAGADPARGRFRSFLLGALKHFLAEARKHDRRLKRAAELVPLGPTGTDTAADSAARALSARSITASAHAPVEGSAPSPAAGVGPEAVRR